MNHDRMTPEALAEIANRAELVVRNHADWSVAAAVLVAGRDVPALLDEISRAWAENAQLCETIVRDREANREICEGMAAQNARLRAELEAAKRDMRLLSDEYKFCNMCKYHNGEGVDTCSHPLRFSCDTENFYEWRGVPANAPAQGETDETRGGGEG